MGKTLDVIGYDPFLSVNSALKLDKKVQIAETLDSLYAKCDYITIHVPQTNDTKGMINAAAIKNMKDGVRIINIARGGLVNNADIIAALDSGKVAALITDFAAEELLNIASFINQARGDVAYNIIDVDGVVTDDIIEKLKACDTVNRVRPIFG